MYEVFVNGYYCWRYKTPCNSSKGPRSWNDIIPTRKKSIIPFITSGFRGKPSIISWTPWPTGPPSQVFRRPVRPPVQQRPPFELLEMVSQIWKTPKNHDKFKERKVQLPEGNREEHFVQITATWGSQKQTFRNRE